MIWLSGNWSAATRSRSSEMRTCRFGSAWRSVVRTPGIDSNFRRRRSPISSSRATLASGATSASWNKVTFDVEIRVTSMLNIPDGSDPRTLLTCRNTSSYPLSGSTLDRNSAVRITTPSLMVALSFLMSSSSLIESSSGRTTSRSISTALAPGKMTTVTVQGTFSDGSSRRGIAKKELNPSAATQKKTTSVNRAFRRE